MAVRGKSINVFLIDGDANRKIKVTISNWNGIAYKIPRPLLEECKDYEAFSHSGIYFLFGPNGVYIGQAEVRSSGEALYRRIMEHSSDRLKDVWDEVVICTTRDNTFGKTDISFLENYFYEQAIKKNRVTVYNNNTPSPGTVTEEKQSELEEYADSVELILNVLGYKVFASTVVVEHKPIHSIDVPPLPNENMKIGAFVYQALLNLSNSGYRFSEEIINEMCTSEWSKEVFHTKKPFMKRYVPGKTDNKGQDGRPRFKVDPYQFGDIRVLISKEWYEYQRELFVRWYESLSKCTRT